MYTRETLTRHRTSIQTRRCRRTLVRTIWGAAVVVATANPGTASNEIIIKKSVHQSLGERERERERGGSGSFRLHMRLTNSTASEQQSSNTVHLQSDFRLDFIFISIPCSASLPREGGEAFFSSSSSFFFPPSSSSSCIICIILFFKAITMANAQVVAKAPAGSPQRAKARTRSRRRIRSAREVGRGQQERRYRHCSSAQGHGETITRRLHEEEAAAALDRVNE